jgi:DNA invertase Pin-like site-specific DNA recombinase/peptidoglycan hydrolase-like protein with peptidoglycan-binding domain
MGDKPSKRVRTLQRALTGRGYSVGAPGIDGRFGPLTAGAVRRFQTDFNLVVDGIVGPRTRRVLGLSTRTRARRSPDSGARRTRPRRPRTSPPQAGTPPQAQTTPPQAQASPPRAQTTPPQSQTNPPQAQTSPPQAQTTSPTTQDRPAATTASGRNLEADRPSPWRLVLIAGAVAGAVIAALWALGRAVSRRVARRAPVAAGRDRAHAGEPDVKAVSADASRGEARASAAERSEIEATPGGADGFATASVDEPDGESPGATPVGEPRRGQTSPRFSTSAGGAPADASKHAGPAEPADRPLIGYVTVERSVRADTVHSQARAIDQACEAAGWELLAIVRDTEGGRTFDRPGLRYALERIADGEAAGLIVSDLKLLSRSVVDLGSLLAWFWDAGAALIALDLGVDTSTSEGHHAASALITLSAWERERTAQGAGLHVAEGRPGGREPDAGWLADRPDLVERIVAMKRHGMTLRAIANQLNAEQVPTVRGGTEWRASTVQAVLNYHRGRSWPREQLPSPTRRFR